MMLIETRRGTSKNAAVALAEASAESVPFQRKQPGVPPAQNVNSAGGSLKSACHFGGKYAKFAKDVQFVQKFAKFAKIFGRRTGLIIVRIGIL